MKKLTFAAIVALTLTAPAYATEYNVMVFSIITKGQDIAKGQDTRQKLHFRTTEDCMVAQRALNKSLDLLNEQADDERSVSL